MRKQQTIGGADIEQRGIVTRRKPGPTRKPRPICAYAPCTNEAPLGHIYCNISHAMMDRKRPTASVAKGVATKRMRRANPKPAPTHPLFAPDEDNDLISSAR